MAIEVKIVAHSINDYDSHLVTFLLRYPRFIHSEFMTHRVFSRNAASSRAIPVKKIIAQVINDPACPVSWGGAKKGMQAGEQLKGWRLWAARNIFLGARYPAVAAAMILNWIGLHKQVANRILEPWMYMTTLATASQLGNFFNLRVHKDAQPEFQVLARMMLEAFVASVPKRLTFGEWHIPFNSVDIAAKWSLEDKLKICTARCARTSYLNFEGVINYTKDIEMHDNLAKSGHWSPFEHCAQANAISTRAGGNFGLTWFQYRKKFPTENQEHFDAEALLKGGE